MGREGVVCKRNLLIEQGRKEREGEGREGKVEGGRGGGDNMLGKQYSLSTSPEVFSGKGINNLSNKEMRHR